jgi:hypothetical protein
MIIIKKNKKESLGSELRNKREEETTKSKD